jgi:chromosome segregation ATPase
MTEDERINARFERIEKNLEDAGRTLSRLRWDSIEQHLEATSRMLEQTTAIEAETVKRLNSLMKTVEATSKTVDATSKTLDDFIRSMMGRKNGKG